MQFFKKLYSHIDENSGEKFEDIFLVKMASKGTSLSCIIGSFLSMILIPNDFV